MAWLAPSDVAESVARIATAHFSGHPRAPALRAQAALVRTLFDEIGRYAPSDRRRATLGDQLQEELARLDRLLEDAAA